MNATPVCELPRLPRRDTAGHKGTYGKVLVVAGSRGLSGAAVLTGRAALRTGAGLVQVASPTDVQPIVAASYPAYTTHGFGENADEVIELARSVDVVALGPGLGREPATVTFVRQLLAGITDKPIVLDADGLFAVSPFAKEFMRTAPFVLTPHPGEFARLTGEAAPETDSERAGCAVAFAQTYGCVLLLKGTGTVVSDGAKRYRNTTGNPGMATGGTGDVLTGVIAALVAQGLSAFDAAVLGAWIHGRAGDRAAAALGQTALTATDLLDYLSTALLELETHWGEPCG